MAAAGLAQNFGALRALTTSGIQQGHMKMHLQNILNQLGANDIEKEEITTYFEAKTVTHAAVVSKFNALRKPKITWVDFLNTEAIRNKLTVLSMDEKPVFGKMNGQQMVEHLSFLMQISNGIINANHFVEDEKSARRKPFLDTDGELQVGFKAPMLSEEPTPVKFKAMQGSIADLLQQITSFEMHFEKVTSENHPFFGGLDYDYWKKFHVKHFTHHFKQFNLI
jgi:hydroxymethylglutaryl-CoA reductase